MIAHAVDIGGYSVEQGDWLAICVLAFFVALTCGFLVVKGS